MKPIKNVPALADQRQFGLWKAFFFSFFSTRVYVDVAKRWSGLGLSYLMLLLVIVTAPFGLRFEWAAHQYYKVHVFEPSAHFPSVVIEDGEVQFNHFMPYRVTNQSGDTIAVIDATGLTREINHRVDPELTWLLTKNALHFNPPDLKVTPNLKISFEKSAHIETFDEELNGVLDVHSLLDRASVKLFIYGALILIYPCLIGAVWGLFATFFLAFSWATQYYVLAVFRYRMEYAAIYRLLIVSLTAPVSICFILAGLGVVYSEAGLYYLVLFAVYFNLGVAAVRRADRALVLA